MLNSTALNIAKTGLQEIRILLHKGRARQALEMAEALRNLPVEEGNQYQNTATKQGLKDYLKKHSDRKKLSHWQKLIARETIEGISDSKRVYE